MTKPKFFRDPLHLQIRFDAVDLSVSPTKESVDANISWCLQKIIDTESFQRLRHLRQNGLTNYVFHGAEHSRFSHSMGVSHLARRMYEKLCKNSSIEIDSEKQLHVAVASLVHDLGHGPFSHTMEEILKANNITFDHEEMTYRFIIEGNSDVNLILKEFDPELPNHISKYFKPTLRNGDDDFVYKIISSQMDADRLDYVQRDALSCGIRGHGFDMERLLDLIFVSNDVNIAVDRGAIEAVEAYLITLDQMWRAVYYHQAVRSASVMVTSLFTRAFYLFQCGDKEVFPDIGGKMHPMALLFEKGQKIPLTEYQRLTDATAWSLIDCWRLHNDSTLKDLSNRLTRRNLLKSVEIDFSKFKDATDLHEKAKELTRKEFPDIANVEDYYVILDDPTRTSYKSYDWKAEAQNKSIWLTSNGTDEKPIEADDKSGIISALKTPRKFERLFVTENVRNKLTKS